jgi:hypothetical protein
MFGGRATKFGPLTGAGSSVRKELMLERSHELKRRREGGS